MFFLFRSKIVCDLVGRKSQRRGITASILQRWQMLLDQLWALVRLCCREPAELSQAFSNQRIGLMLRTFCHWVKEGRKAEKRMCFNFCTESAYKKVFWMGLKAFGGHYFSLHIILNLMYTMQLPPFFYIFGILIRFSFIFAISCCYCTDIMII